MALGAQIHRRKFLAQRSDGEFDAGMEITAARVSAMVSAELSRKVKL
jgi:hypothetical protein